MCGITGFIDTRERHRDAAKMDACVSHMAQRIAHRGPDGAGTFVDASHGVALAHRRLSIIDLSEAGAQPMTSRDGRWVITFNGEIYNFEELRTRINSESPDGFAWRGHSDTEVLLECVSRWGVVKTLQASNGMFALALWDKRDKVLTLARDRMGEKPLYYGFQQGVFFFGSELKAMVAHPDFQRRLNESAVAAYLTYCYVPVPLSIYQGIHKLEPGRYIEVPAHNPNVTPAQSIAYWELPFPNPQDIGEQDAVAELERLLSDSIRLRMYADVPMGAFLSGGIDSSLVVALMQKQSRIPVRTFSIGFEEDAYDESKHAAVIAKHLQTDHTAMYVTAKDALDVIPSLPEMYDEPFADSSQIPTYLLSKLTRQHVTVALSGDGGDELFGGYTRYFTYGPLWGRFRHFPLGLRQLTSGVLRRLPSITWETISRIFDKSPLLGNINHHRVHSLARAIASANGHEYYRQLVGFWSPELIMKTLVETPSSFFDRHNIESDFQSPILGMAYTDMGSYLPDDILVKVDRATMASSLESRIPLLDLRVVAFAAKLPISLKVSGGIGKIALRRLVQQYVPATSFERPKQGFAMPIAEWLRTSLLAWSQELMCNPDTSITRMINLDAVKPVWHAHLNGQEHQPYKVWNVLMLIAWSREWKPH